MIYIIHSNYFLIDDLKNNIKNNINNEKVVFIEVNLKNANFYEKILRRYPCTSSDKYLNLEFLEKINLKNEDILIFFDCFKSPYFNLIKKYKNNRKILWIWNKVREDEKKYIQLLKNEKVELWTFDREDSIKLKLNFTSQFFWRKIKEKFEEKKGIFFIGLDKGRYNQIERLGRIYQGKKDFVILRDKTSKKNEKKYYQNKLLNYGETLKKIEDSLCLLEITLEKQSGITLRALEALFFKKKLITNNKDIKNYNFYHPNNIFILEENYTNEEINEFLKKEYFNISIDIIKNYTFENWLNKITNKTNI